MRRMNATQSFATLSSTATIDMERALCIDEVVREIIGHLRPPLDTPIYYPGGRVPNQKTLFNAALVCKRFSSHALDALWYVMKDLIPLLDLLPSTKLKWLYCPDGDSKVSATIKAPLCSEDFETFERYARRIQAYENSDWLPTDSCVHHILQKLGRPYLLPNLRLFYDYSPRFEYLYFIAPTLRHIQCWYSDTKMEVPELLSMLSVSPRIRTLQLFNLDIKEEDFPLLHAFPDLTELSTTSKIVLGPRTEELMPFAPQLIKFHVYDLTFAAGFDPSWKFASLRKLALGRVADIESVTALLVSDILPCVTELSLDVTAYSTQLNPYSPAHNEHWLAFFAAVARRTPALQYLRIRYHNIDREEWATSEEGVGLDIERFLKVFPKPMDSLASLTIEPYVLKPFSEASYPALAATFPSLKHLSIGLLPNAFLSLKSLSVLANCFKNLNSIKLNARSDDISCNGEVGKEYSGLLPNERLEHYDLWKSKVGNSHAFAIVLDSLFPCVNRRPQLMTRRRVLIDRYFRTEDARYVDEDLRDLRSVDQGESNVSTIE